MPPPAKEGIDSWGLQWQIDKMSFSYKDTRTRVDYFTTIS